MRHSHYNIGGLFNGPWKPSPFYSPHIANLASLLIAGLPNLAEDIKFVLKKTLGEFEMELWGAVQIEYLVAKTQPWMHESLEVWLSMIAEQGARV